MQFEIQTLLRSFNEWLHENFVPASQLGQWERRDGSDILRSEDLQAEFFKDRPDIRGLLGKAGLLVLLLSFFCAPVSGTVAPVKVVTVDTVKTDTLPPLAFKIIRKIKPNKQ